MELNERFGDWFYSGKKASSVRAFDNVESRKGYSGLYQFGASYNPGKFTSPTSATPRSGNYLLYWMASKPLARGSERVKGFGWDACVRLESAERQPQQHNAHGRVALQRAAALHIHKHDSLGYVRNMLSPEFFPPGMPAKTSTALSSTLFWTFYQCSFYSP